MSSNHKSQSGWAVRCSAVVRRLPCVNHNVWDEDCPSCLKRTIKQLSNQYELCKTGRWHEWEQHCQLTKVISRTAQGLNDAAQNDNEQCRRAYRKLNAITQYLWLVPAEKCEARMPSNDQAQPRGN